jgi:hypothetical protein
MTSRFACLAIASLATCALTAAAQSPAAKPQWFKGNTHTHSLWSDGNDFPEMICDWYASHGYHFLSLTDHNKLHTHEVWMSEAGIKKRQKALGRTALDKYRARFGDAWVQSRALENGQGKEVRLRRLDEYRSLFEKPGSFLLVQGEEITASFAKAPLHLNAINIAEELQPAKADSIVATLRANLQAVAAQEKRTGQPILVHINHPNFKYALTAEELAEALEERYFEIYNGHPGINYHGDADHAGNEKLWDIANTLRLAVLKAPLIYGMGTDDSHHYHGEDNSPGRGWVMVRAASLDAASLVKAMRAGDFYASSGVTLEDISDQDGTLRLRVRAEPGVTYTTRIIGTPKNYDATTKTATMPKGDSHATRLVYSDDIGKTFATLSGPEVSYRRTGEELYIRAVITSDKPHPNPSFKGQTEAAWTQPTQ